MDVSTLMRRHSRMAVIATAVAVVFGTGASAQDSTRENENRAEAEIARSGAGMQALDQYLQGDSLRVSELIGMEVQNRSGDNLGQIEDVLRAAGAGQDMQLIVHVGGIGADDKLIAIGFDEIQISADGDELYTNRTRDQLAAAPAVALEPRGNIARLAQRDADDADRENANRAAAARDAAREPRGAEPQAGGAGAQAGTASMQQRRLGDLVGAEVVGADGEQVGEVDDIVISTAGADSLRAVLQVGGLAGIGEKRVALPLGQVTVDRSDDGEAMLRVAMDQEALERLPEFDYEEDTEAL